jgi:arylsulfatase A-like enzyme
MQLDQSTLVIFTSDNGGYARFSANRPWRSQKGTPYEGGLRVPLIVRLPGTPREKTICDQPVSGLDLLPTILAAANVPSVPDVPLDGTSFWDHLLHQRPTTARKFFWHFPHYCPYSKPYSVVRDGEWKLIRYYESNRRELYNLARDPYEKENVADRQPGILGRLEADLDQWLQTVGAKLPLTNRDYDPSLSGAVKRWFWRLSPRRRLAAVGGAVFACLTLVGLPAALLVRRRHGRFQAEIRKSAN